ANRSGARIVAGAMADLGGEEAAGAALLLLAAGAVGLLLRTPWNARQCAGVLAGTVVPACILLPLACCAFWRADPASPPVLVAVALLFASLAVVAALRLRAAADGRGRRASLVLRELRWTLAAGLVSLLVWPDEAEVWIPQTCVLLSARAAWLWLGSS